MSKEELANSPHTPSETLTELSKDKDHYVRLNVAENPTWVNSNKS